MLPINDRTEAGRASGYQEARATTFRFGVGARRVRRHGLAIQAEARGGTACARTYIVDNRVDATARCARLSTRTSDSV